MYDDTEYKEIEELIRKIKMAAFKEESFLFVEKRDGEVKEEEFKVCTKFYSLNSLNRKYPITFKWRNDLEGIAVNKNSQIIWHEFKDKSTILDNFERIDEFISDIAEIIGSCKHMMTQEFEKKLIENIKKNIMDQLKKCLFKVQHLDQDGIDNFSQDSIDTVLGILAEDLDKKYKEPKNYYKEAHKDLRDRERRAEENGVIEQIYSHYKKNLNAEYSGRIIISNIAYVFAAADFWNDNIEDPNRVRRYRDRIKKRLIDFNE